MSVACQGTTKGIDLSPTFMFMFDLASKQMFMPGPLFDLGCTDVDFVVY